MTIVGACSTAARTDGRVDQLTLMRGNIGGYEFNRMVVLFSMMDGPKEIPSAPLRWTIWNTSRGQRPTSANDNSCDFGIGSNNAHRGNSSPGSSRAILPASFCAVSIFANSFGQALCSKDFDALLRNQTDPSICASRWSGRPSGALMSSEATGGKYDNRATIVDWLEPSDHIAGFCNHRAMPLYRGR